MNMYWIGLAVLVLINSYVSIFLLRRNDLESIQKVLQIVIVWLIPLIGAIGLWLFHRSQDDNDSNKPGTGSFGGGSNDSIGA